MRMIGNLWRSCISVLGTVLLICFCLGCRAEKNEKDLISAALPENTTKPSLERYASTIRVEEIRKHVFSLASDLMEGRHTGTAGSEKAQVLIMEYLESLGLKKYSQESGYLQKFRMIKKKMVESVIESSYKRLEGWKDYMELFCEFEGDRSVDLVFAGFGLEDDLDTIDLGGKLAAFYQGSPRSSDYSEDFERLKITACRKRGAVGIISIVDREDILRKRIRDLKPYLDVERFYQIKSTEELAAKERRIVLGENSAAELFGITAKEFRSHVALMKTGQSGAGRLRTEVRMITSFSRGDSIQAANIIAFLEGTDKKEECVVVSAHYDHLGIEGGLIHNGAYDNAAGVAAVLAVARAFSEAASNGIRPKRRMVFYLCDAEELGGVGTMHFLDYPPFPLKHISADINVDGIGREDESRPRLKDFVHFYMSRAGRDKLQEIRDSAAAAGPKLRLVPRESYGGSDHTFFERVGIPVIALSTGHPKDHHKPTDTADKLDYKNIRDIARLAFACAWLIADADQMIGQEAIQ